jgi:sterol desaturase/sphingolipid hydroxylase (fatty acid hydroxylase superfamily)
LPPREPFLAGRLPFWLQVVGVLLLTDFFSYWVHRLHHHIDLLWGMHAVHHDPPQIDWLVAARVHPAELIVGKLLCTVPVYALGFLPDAFGLTVPLAAVYSLLLHANLTWDFGVIGYLLASPAFHRWHHSSERAALDKNFAQVFSFYDYLFGTAYFPSRQRSKSYGLVGGERVPDGILGQLLHPISRQLKKLASSSPRNVGNYKVEPVVEPSQCAGDHLR